MERKILGLISAVFLLVVLVSMTVSAYPYYSSDEYYRSYDSRNSRYYSSGYATSSNYEKTRDYVDLGYGGYQKRITTVQTYTREPSYYDYGTHYSSRPWYEKYWDSPYPRYYDNEYYSWEPPQRSYYYYSY